MLKRSLTARWHGIWSVRSDASSGDAPRKRFFVNIIEWNLDDRILGHTNLGMIWISENALFAMGKILGCYERTCAVDCVWQGFWILAKHAREILKMHIDIDILHTFTRPRAKFHQHRTIGSTPNALHKTNNAEKYKWRKMLLKLYEGPVETIETGAKICIFYYFRPYCKTVGGAAGRKKSYSTSPGKRKWWAMPAFSIYRQSKAVDRSATLSSRHHWIK